ncbi:MAG TPA: CRTAC1 family protein [Blastocatellia bacterium]|nr:CRTAC1 family protein [Blastocatellia bacterium]
MSAVAHIKEYKKGKFYTDEFRGDISWNGYERNVLLRNEGRDPAGTLRFTEIASALGADDERDGRGMAIADFDNDGDLDIVINNNPGDNGIESRARATLLRNNVGERRNWIAFELNGSRSNRDAVGAVVAIEAAGRKQVRYVAAGSGYASQNTSRLCFGLAGAAEVDAVTVTWPSGVVDRFSSVKSNQLIQVTEGGGMAVAPLRAKGASM